MCESGKLPIAHLPFTTAPHLPRHVRQTQPAAIEARRRLPTRHCMLCCRRRSSTAAAMAAADAATATWLADTSTSSAMPWEAFTQASELDADADLYCVATWGIMSLLAAPAFMRNSPGKSTLQQLPRGQCVGVSMSVRLAWPFHFVAETLTVWHDRKHSTAFYRSDAHRQGTEALRGRVEFRARRVWVNAADLPRPGDGGGTRALWNAVKRGEHRAVEESQER